MVGRGLQELLEVIFARNTVAHILSGKAVARAIRGHLLLDSVLHTILLCNLFESKLSLSSDKVPVELAAIADLYDDLDSCKTTMQDVESSVELRALQMKLDMFTEALESKHFTAKLWLEYMEMVNIVRAFIKSERTGCWSHHLRTLQDMLPYLAAYGQKSLYVYLKQMIRSENMHPDVHRQFTQGMHVIRRSDRCWAGLSPDLVIEQVLMRSLKPTGSLMRVRGMTETQRLVWCLVSVKTCLCRSQQCDAATAISHI